MYIGLRIAAFMFGLGIAIPAVHATLQPNSYPPTGAVLSCQGRPWIDIMCYGADPTNVTDSSTAINTAITDAIAAGGVPVHFPSGTFKIGLKLTFDYAAVAATGLKIISDNATLNATGIGGTALQIQCSGGTPGSPALCNNLEIRGPLTVKGNAPSGYVVVVGTTNFADMHSGVRLDHLIATNAASAVGAGGIQLNYIVGREIWVSGNTLGGGTAAAVALEQVQNSKISGDGTATGPTASSLLIENGVTTGNLITAFDYNSGTAISLSITSPTAKANTFLSPVFNGTTAINANQFASGNAIIGATYNGTNKGPSSTGVNIVGRGSLNRYSAPTAATLLLTGADDGTIFSPANGTGAGSPFTAVTLNFTLPTPSQVGAGWTAAFLSDNSKASVVNPPGGSSILTSAGQQLSTMTVGAPNAVNYEVAVIESDGTNFRLIYATPATMQANGSVSAHFPSTWEFPSTSGYAAQQGDNGNVLDNAAVGGPFIVTLPSTTSITSGWTMGVVADGFPATVNVNGTSGGKIVNPAGALVSSINQSSYGMLVFQFDGASFRIITPLAPFAQCAANGVTDDTACVQAAINTLSSKGTIAVPAGTYCIKSGPLTMTGAGAKLQGQGQRASVFSACGADVAILSESGSGNTISNMTFIGSPFPGTTKDVISVTGCCEHFIENVRASGGNRAFSALTAYEIYLLDSSMDSTYGNAIVYLTSTGGYIRKGKFDQAYPFATPAAASAPFPVQGWTSGHAYPVGSLVSTGGYILQATVGGTSGGSPPTIPSYGVARFDGSVTWGLVGATTYYGLQCDTLCGFGLSVTDSDFSADETAGIGFTDTLSAGAPHGIILSSNTFGTNLYNNIVVLSGFSLQIENNQFGGGLVSNPSSAISLVGAGADNIISGNLIQQGGPGTTGIFVNSTNTNIENNIFSVKTGISVAAGITHFRIIGNSCFSGFGVTPVCVFVAPGPSDFYSIIGNDSSGDNIGSVFDGGTGTHKIVLAEDSPEYGMYLPMHWRAQTPTAVITSGFGGSPTISGSDVTGRIVVGSGGANTGQITLGITYQAHFPNCFANDETSAIGTRVAALSGTLLQFSSFGGNWNGGDTITYFCAGN